MENGCNQDHVVIGEDVYLFFTNVEKDSQDFYDYITKRNEGKKIIFKLPAFASDGTVLKGSVAIFLLKEDYDLVLNEIMDDIETIESLLEKG